MFLKNKFSQKFLRHTKNKPGFEAKRARVERGLRTTKLFYRVLLASPIVLFLLTVLASLEHTPLTGRWRAIILSSEEEDVISEQLQGAGWYSAVHGIIAQDGPVRIVPADDWRYQWVQTVLRQLEEVIPILAHETELDFPWLERGPDDVPLPPPSKHPLRPRSSPKEYLRYACNRMKDKGACAGSVKNDFKNDFSESSPHLIPGPPYNLLLVDRPDCDNAFSFGFGPNGAGGIVVYTGFLDSVIATNPRTVNPKESPNGSRSYLAALLGSFYPSSSPSSSLSPPPCQPTPEQNTQLAILLAHELAHLILAHHLETLSSGTIVVPGTVAILSDLMRAMLFPFTMLFGPFVNDAVAALGHVGTGEAQRISEYCTSMKQEFEADAVSARILAHAGLDARATVAFWERRREASASECSPRRAAQNAGELPHDDQSASATALRAATKLAMRIGGERHPGNAARVVHLKMELKKWQMAREKVLRKQAGETRWQRWTKRYGFGRQDGVGSG